MKAWQWRKVPVTDRVFGRSVIDENGCHIFTGPKDGKGYGQIRYEGKAWRVHRWVYQHVNGPIPEGMGVLHKCDVPACINTAHLFLGTQKENMQDCADKKRANKPSGYKHKRPMAKVTDSDVEKIKQLLARGYRQCDIAKDFSVSRQIISDIALGKTWAHIPNFNKKDAA